MRLSKNFKSKEFRCKCGCGKEDINPSLIVILQMLRVYLDKPIKISSGLRCEEYNEKVGGVKNSQHVLGNACDIQIDGIEPIFIFNLLNKLFPKSLGLGVYNTFVHIDCRFDRGYRWDKRSSE